MSLIRVIEALLFSAQKPLSIREMTAAIKDAGTEDELSRNEFADIKQAEVAAALQQLKGEYIQQQRAFQIIEKAEGWQLATDPAFAGRVEIPGRPLLYETTQFFLDHFGLRDLDELPNVEELRTRRLPVARPSAGGIGNISEPGSPPPATTNL